MRSNLQIALAAALLMQASCGSEEIAGRDVVAVGRSSQNLTSAELQSVNGTYGVNCRDRASGVWSLAIAGSAVLDHPTQVLSVVQGDADCVLTLTELHTTGGGIQAAAPPILLSTSFTAATFGSAFVAAAALDDATFADDFVLTVLFPADPALDAGGNTAIHTQAITLGSAANFAVLAETTITNTGITFITGDVGLSLGTEIVALPAGDVEGDIVTGTDPIAMAAKADLQVAYEEAEGLTRLPDGLLSGDIGGSTYFPGLYTSPDTVAVTGTLTLDADGDPNAVFIFRMGSTLTTTAASTIELIDGASAANVFWQVGSSATIGAGSTFVGTILAFTSISVGNGAAFLNGRALAMGAAVTLDTNTIVRPTP